MYESRSKCIKPDQDFRFVKHFFHYYGSLEHWN